MCCEFLKRLSGCFLVFSRRIVSINVPFVHTQTLKKMLFVEANGFTRVVVDILKNDVGVHGMENEQTLGIFRMETTN
jgi:hypothetical protein